MDFENFEGFNLPQRKINQLAKAGITDPQCLLQYYPIRYEERGGPLNFEQLERHVDEKVVVFGTIRHVQVNQQRQFIRVSLAIDQVHPEISIFWFHQMYLAQKFCVNSKLAVYGKLTQRYKNGYSLSAAAFHVDVPDASELTLPLPVYSKIQGMAPDYLRNLIKESICKYASGLELVEPKLKAAFQLDDTEVFLQKVHFPKNRADIESAQRFREIALLGPFVKELGERQARSVTTIIIPPGMEAVSKLRMKLPYKLTADQEKAVELMTAKMASSQRMDVLLQADVGAGKTVCAMFAVTAVIAAGFQAAVMAPTAVLAEQHYRCFSQYFDPEDVVLLTGKLKAKERRAVLEKISSGSAKVIVGTHAAISADTVYDKLALTVVDEEHRFGVAQRELLKEKAAAGAHHLSMSATPIPRSLALIMHGNGNVIELHTLPPGRKEVKTIVYSNEYATYQSLGNQIRLGHQGYVICPVIEADNALNGVDSLEETFGKLQRFFAGTGIKVACIHSGLKSAVIESEIAAFVAGDTDILCSTTIVEVGINVPNATVMVVKSADRFGLAQLHQLRGRVGRSNDQGFCVLLGPPDNTRLQLLASTSNGFEVAEADLKIRGAGNLIGNEQSGFTSAFEVMLEKPELFERIRKVLTA